MITLRPLALISLVLVSTSGWTLDVSAKSAIIVDELSGKILWQKDAYTSRYPASTTKIMTGMLLLEHCTPDEWIIAPKGVDKIEPSSMNLRVGEKVSARGMLYALMLRSANDGCFAVANHIGGSVTGFAKMMNDRARQIGCLNTNFNNPHGLKDKKHTTTAYDLSLMAREAMKYEEFRNVVKTQKKTIVRSINHKDLLMKSHNKWLAKDISADGIKTGYTKDAGRCYVGSATRNGYRIITVILNSEDWQLDHQNMLNWAYKNYERVLHAAKGSEVAKLARTDSNLPEIPVLVDADIYHVRRLVNPEAITVTPEYTIAPDAPVSAGDPIGTATFSDESGWKMTAPLLAGATTVRAVPLTASLGGKAGFGILGLALVGGLAGVYSRRRAKSYAKTPF